MTAVTVVNDLILLYLSPVLRDAKTIAAAIAHVANVGMNQIENLSFASFLKKKKKKEINSYRIIATKHRYGINNLIRNIIKYDIYEELRTFFLAHF